MSIANGQSDVIPEAPAAEAGVFRAFQSDRWHADIIPTFNVKRTTLYDALGKTEIPMADLVTFLAFYPFIQSKPHLIKIRKTPPLLQKLCYKWSGSALIKPEDWDW